MWTNTSLPPPSGWMKPYPFCALNHFTVPIVKACLHCHGRGEPTVASNQRPHSWDRRPLTTGPTDCATPSYIQLMTAIGLSIALTKHPACCRCVVSGALSFPGVAIGATTPLPRTRHVSPR
jgi:hypothetical protein